MKRPAITVATAPSAPIFRARTRPGEKTCMRSAAGEARGGDADEARADRACRQKQRAMCGQPQIAAAAARAVADAAVRAEISRNGFPEIVRPVGLDGLLRELSAVGRPRQIAVEQRSSYPIAPDGGDSAAAHEDLAPPVPGCPDDRTRCHLRLEDGRHWLRLAGHARAAPV